MTLSKLFLAVLIVSITMTSCSADELNKKAEATANNFYDDLQNKAYDSALALCSPKAFTKDTKESWETALKKNNFLLGNVVSFTKTSGFNIETSTTVGTTVTVTYDVQWQYGKSKDSLFLVKEKDGSMKLLKYTWKHFDAAYIKKTRESETLADQYMKDVKATDYDAALAMCSDNALKMTPKENWKTVLNTAVERFGAISNYQILQDISYYNIAASGQAGEGNYYDIYVKTKRNDGELMEKIIFYQKDYDVPLKLVGHQFL